MGNTHETSLHVEAQTLNNPIMHATAYRHMEQCPKEKPKHEHFVYGNQRAKINEEMFSACIYFGDRHLYKTKENVNA